MTKRLVVVLLALIVSACNANSVGPTAESPPPVTGPGARKQVAEQAFSDLRTIRAGDPGFGLIPSGPNFLPMTIKNGELEIRVQTSEAGALLWITPGFKPDVYGRDITYAEGVVVPTGPDKVGAIVFVVDAPINYISIQSIQSFAPLAGTAKAFY